MLLEYELVQLPLNSLSYFFTTHFTTAVLTQLLANSEQGVGDKEHPHTGLFYCYLSHCTVKTGVHEPDLGASLQPLQCNVSDGLGLHRTHVAQLMTTLLR